MRLPHLFAVPAQRGRVPALCTMMLLAVTLLAGCGYFNALYNARRIFDEAEAAAARGEENRAATRYEEAIASAAESYRGHPDGRWSDDALYLIVRSHFGRGAYPEAAVAAEQLRMIAQDEDTRLGAQAYRGAALVRLDSAAQARPQLDSVVAVTEADRELGAFARLWRARALFATDAPVHAWADLDAARQIDGPLGVEAMLETAARALQFEDSARLRSASAGLLAMRDAALRRDTVVAIGDAAAARWGPAFARSVLAAPTDWQPGAADSVAVVRAHFAAQAGNAATALETFADIYSRTAGPTGNAARREAAMLMLQSATTEDLPAIRAVLLPAILDPGARDLANDLEVVSVLAARGRAGQPLALFAAAEHARDRLSADALARGLFLEYADLAPTSEWAPKAVLAALALVSDDAQRATLVARLQQTPSNVYAATFAGGGDQVDLLAAEERLARVVGALREGAVQEAGQRNRAIDRAVAVVDSIRADVVADSMLLMCGARVDSLALIGIRADSARVACVRSDSARFNAVLVIDTLELVDSAATVVDSTTVRERDRLRTNPDTAAIH